MIRDCPCAIARDIACRRSAPLFQRVSTPTSVHNLATKQPLTFEPKGLTIAYGDNGARKSGDARILERVCRGSGGAGRFDFPVRHSEITACVCETR